MDRSRVADPEIAAESERERLLALAAKFSAEDLMRAFDVLTKAEADIRAAAQPRYHLEMALLRWVHLRKLVPLADVIANLEKGGPGPVRGAAAPAPTSRPASPPPSRLASRAPTMSSTVRAVEAREEDSRAGAGPLEDDGNGTQPAPAVQPVGTAGLKDAFLAEVQRSKKFFYGTVIAQAQKIDVERDRIVLTFAPQHRPLRLQLDASRAWMEDVASRLAGTRMAVIGVESGSTVTPGKPCDPAVAPEGTQERQAALKKQAMANSGVQAMLDVFAAEIKEVDEM
jgi:DNA polymerase-3 subunit gamma/tau